MFILHGVRHLNIGVRHVSIGVRHLVIMRHHKYSRVSDTLGIYPLSIHDF